MMTDKMIASALDDMVIVVDTREKRNEHITSYLDTIGRPYIKRAMKSADYTVTFNKEEFLPYKGCVMVERKNSFDEIIGNFTKNRKRFVNEFERIDDGVLTSIVIENSSWNKLFKGSWRSKVPSQAILASLLTWTYRYDTRIWYCQRKESPEIIYWLLYYGVMETLKGEQ